MSRKESPEEARERMRREVLLEAGQACLDCCNGSSDRLPVMRAPLFKTLRETADELGVSHAQVIIIERRALGKLLLGLGLFTYDELPWRIRKFFKRPPVAT